MAHNINYDKKTNTFSFVSHAEVAWHGLGKTVDHAMNFDEVVKEANLDYEVALGSVNAGITLENGEVIYPTYENRFSTYRKDTNEILGQVGSIYEIVQNKDAFTFFDALIDRGEAIYETAGVLGKGERIFVTAKLPEDILVNGEPCKKYIMLTNSHDGSSSIIAGFTSVRVVCENTLQAALSNMPNKVAIPHKMGAKEKLAEAYKVLQMSTTYMDEVSKIFNTMAETAISDDELRKFITKCMQPKKKILTQEEALIESTRFKNRVESIYQFAKKHPTQLTSAANGTVWGAYNSISGYFQYIADHKNQEQKFNNIMFGRGSNTISKAFNESLLLLPQ